MPFLALDGTTIPCAIDDAEGEVQEFGDRDYAHDGTLQTRLRARKDRWPLITPWLTSASASTVLAALTAQEPTAATGDLTGSVSVYVEMRGKHVKTVDDGERRIRYAFTVHVL